MGALADDREQDREPDRARAEARRAEAEASLAELKLARLRGELASASDFEAELERAFTAVRARLLAIPPKLAPILSAENPAKTRALLDAAVLEALAELQALGDDEDEADGTDALAA
jgi:phage terminase Nu1 subunit (DNA packaging protein)